MKTFHSWIDKKHGVAFVTTEKLSRTIGLPNTTCVPLTQVRKEVGHMTDFLVKQMSIELVNYDGQEYVTEQAYANMLSATR